MTASRHHCGRPHVAVPCSQYSGYHPELLKCLKPGRRPSCTRTFHERRSPWVKHIGCRFLNNLRPAVSIIRSLSFPNTCEKISSSSSTVEKGPIGPLDAMQSNLHAPPRKVDIARRGRRERHLEHPRPCLRNAGHQKFKTNQSSSVTSSTHPE